MEKYKILDLFSGLGGFSLGLERTGHFETVAFCDNNQYSKLILDKHWKGVKIYDDVREISKEKFREDGIEFPDIITGGFPCQPFSVAGKQKGTSDDRHLWPEMFRIIKAFKPRYVIGENVRGIVNIQEGVVFETVCTDLESEGYEVQPFIIPAAGVGAPHRRERVWIIATLVNTENVADTENRRGQPSQSERWQGTERGSIDRGGIEGERKNIERDEDVANSRRTLQSRTELREKNEDEIRKRYANQSQRSSSTSESNVADTYGKRLEGFKTKHKLRDGKEEEQTSGNSWWLVEPDVGRVAYGVSGRVHRLKGLGNSIVPQIAEEIGRAIIKAESKE